MHNLDLHRNLEMPSLGRHFEEVSQKFDSLKYHPNPLIAADYTPDPIPHPIMRRFRYVCTDPDDPMTQANGTQHHEDACFTH